MLTGTWQSTSVRPQPGALIDTIKGEWTKKHVLVVGDVMLDKYIWGEVERISPEAPIPIVRVTRTTEQPGGAANVAMNLAALGARVTLAGFIGEDAAGDSLRTQLEESAICVRLTLLKDRPTISKTRVLGGRQQMLRLDMESSEEVPTTAHAELLSSVLHVLDGSSGLDSVSALVLSDYAKGVLNAVVCQALIQRARQRGIPVIVDPKGRDFSRYQGATLLCPNLAELSMATSTIPNQLDVVLAAGEAMRTQLEVETMVVTLSERGMVALGSGVRQHFPARARQVFDVSGAGDTVTAVLALCQASGVDQPASMQLANLAAGIVVGKIGTAPVQACELVAKLAGERNESTGKISSAGEMAFRAEAWRAAGDKVVFTNGCFDLLHSGHMTLLEEARRCGDRLVVGLNSDASVRSLKGPSRPLTGEIHRARLLAALNVVDGVVIFNEATPMATIRLLQPDVLVKGGDYEKQDVVGGREVESWGGRVEIVPLVAGFSTTLIHAKVLTC